MVKCALPEYFSHLTSRRLYRFFNNRFDLFYDRMLDSKKFGARVMKLMDRKADLLDVKSPRPHEVVFK